MESFITCHIQVKTLITSFQKLHLSPIKIFLRRLKSNFVSFPKMSQNGLIDFFLSPEVSRTCHNSLLQNVTQPFSFMVKNVKSLLFLCCKRFWLHLFLVLRMNWKKNINFLSLTLFANVSQKEDGDFSEKIDFVFMPFLLVAFFSPCHHDMKHVIVS